MDYFTHQGVTYEATALALAHEDGFSVELTDMSTTGHHLAEVRVRGGVITLVYQEPMPAAVFAWWTSLVVGVAELPAFDGEGDG